MRSTRFLRSSIVETPSCSRLTLFSQLSIHLVAGRVARPLLSVPTSTSVSPLRPAGQHFAAKYATRDDIGTSCVPACHGPAPAIMPTADNISGGSTCAHASAYGPPPEPPRTAKRDK